MVIVTLPEPTPVHEAARLQDDLRRADIRPFAWVVNQSFGATDSRDPLLVAKGRQEAITLREIPALASRSVVLPWRADAGILNLSRHQTAEPARR